MGMLVMRLDLVETSACFLGDSGPARLRCGGLSSCGRYPMSFVISNCIIGFCVLLEL